MQAHEMNNSQILLMFHCEQFTGYAIGELEKAFFSAAIEAGFSETNIYWSFSKVIDQSSLRTIECQYKSPSSAKSMDKFLSNHNIKLAFAFDLGYPSAIISILKKHNVQIISYWGASMSSLNSGLKLLAKKAEWFFRKNKPDFFIFESTAMQLTATRGRGIPESRTTVIPTGIDVTRFTPQNASKNYLHQCFGIPLDAKVIFYSGHMEQRKGVHVIIQSAIELVDNRKLNNVYFVICGNKPGEEEPFIETLASTMAKHKVIFGGYRQDLHLIMPNCHLGIVASTGWDSFPMSTLEMAASGLPIVVSKLQGLVETLDEGATGYTFEPGNHLECADKIQLLLENEYLYQKMSENARKRILNRYTRQHQIINLAKRIKAFCPRQH